MEVVMFVVSIFIKFLSHNVCIVFFDLFLIYSFSNLFKQLFIILILTFITQFKMKSTVNLVQLNFT